MKHYECKRCSRKLKTEESQRLGYGKICYEKYKKNLEHYTLLFDIEELPEVEDDADENNRKLAI